MANTSQPLVRFLKCSYQKVLEKINSKKMYESITPASVITLGFQVFKYFKDGQNRAKDLITSDDHVTSIKAECKELGSKIEHSEKRIIQQVKRVQDWGVYRLPRGDILFPPIRTSCTGISEGTKFQNFQLNSSPKFQGVVMLLLMKFQ